MLVLTLLLPTAFAQSSKTGKVEMTDAEIRQQIIKESISNLKGSCPCPYSLDADGEMCGHRSAYSQRGGSADLLREGRDAEDGGGLSEQDEKALAGTLAFPANQF